MLESSKFAIRVRASPICANLASCYQEALNGTFEFLRRDPKTTVSDDRHAASAKGLFAPRIRSLPADIPRNDSNSVLFILTDTSTERHLMAAK